LQPARLLPAGEQHGPTVNTPGALFLRLLTPFPHFAHLSHLLHQLRSQLVQAFIYRLFNLAQRRFRMLPAPLVHPQYILQPCAHLLHVRAPLSLVLLLVHVVAGSWTFSLFYHPFSLLTWLMQKFSAHPRPGLVPAPVNYGVGEPVGVAVGVVGTMIVMALALNVVVVASQAVWEVTRTC